MPNYRRVYIPGSTVFLTWVTNHRSPILTESGNLIHFRNAVRQARQEAAFEIVAAAILPDHVHFIWRLPANDSNYSKRVGRIKVLFTRALRGQTMQPDHLSFSRRRHRESDVWQRRFWEHTIRSEEELAHYLDYVHRNPVKHGFVSCPHLWQYSSFRKWIENGYYLEDWGCRCRD